MRSGKRNLLIVTEAALENPEANPLSEIDMKRVNGVVRNHENLDPHLDRDNNRFYLTPFDYPGEPQSFLTALFNMNTPFVAKAQPTIRLVIPSYKDIDQRMARIKPDHVHIATEGGLGLRTMLYCKKHDIPVSSALHTNWHKYVMDDKTRSEPHKRVRAFAVEQYMRWFHNRADVVRAATCDLKSILVQWGVKPEKIHLISHGIDPNIFHLYAASNEEYVLTVGRVEVGKGVDRFCELDTHGIKKVVVGTGTLEEKLREKYPDVKFVGYKQGEELGRLYSGAKLFVMPSDTETFGMTVIESLACGTHAVALNRGGHRPILNDRKGLGIMRRTLQQGFDEAIKNPGQFLPRQVVAEHIRNTRSWAREAEHLQRMIDASMQKYEHEFAA